MGRSVWTILVLGVLAAVLLTLGMLVTLDTYRQSPAGNRFKFAETIRAEFQFDSAGAEVSPDGAKMVLHVSYLTQKDSKHNRDVQRREMERVAEFAGKSYDGKDKGIIDEIRIHRSEVRGRGCFRKTYTNNLIAEAPREWRKRPNLPPFLQNPEPPSTP